MAVWLLAYRVADLCLGKPSLPSLSASTSVAHCLATLNSSHHTFITVWSCNHPHSECLCLGKLSMVDIICFLGAQHNLASPASALSSPLSVLISDTNPHRVRHIHPSSSLLEAIDLFMEGAHSLVVPINPNSKRSKRTPTSHNGHEFCWLTQEDIIRFLLSSIGLFSPISTLSINTLGIISHDFPIIHYHSPAPSAIAAISRALTDQTSVAVADDAGVLIGEISPLTLAGCDQTVLAAIEALSAGELMTYIECGFNPPQDIARLVEKKLTEKKLEKMLEAIAIDDGDNSTTPLPRSSSYSARMGRRAESIMCHPGSSLVAVMIQAIAHSVNYVWVIEDDSAMVGIVTFASMLKVFREKMESMMML